MGRSAVATLGAAALLALGLVAAAPASAETERMNFTLTGTVRIGARDLTLPEGSVWSATVDTATGAITNGAVSIPSIASVEQGVDVVTTIAESTLSTGTLDLATGAIELTSSYQIIITVPASNATCYLGPVDATPSTDGGSALAGSPAAATLVDEGFTVPAAFVTAECPEALATAVSGGLGAPTTDTSLSLTIARSATAVYLVHGLNLGGEEATDAGGTGVTVCTSDAVPAYGFSFNDVIGPIPMASGRAEEWRLYLGANVDCASPGQAQLLVDQTVTPEGSAMAFVLSSPPGDALEPELAAFPLDVACYQPGQGRLTVANASAAESVDVQIDGASVGQLSYGESSTGPLTAGTRDITVSAGDLPVDIPFGFNMIDPGVAAVFFVVGLQPLPDESLSPVVGIDLNLDLVACAVTPPPAAAPAPTAAAEPVFTG